MHGKYRTARPRPRGDLAIHASSLLECPIVSMESPSAGSDSTGLEGAASGKRPEDNDIASSAQTADVQCARTLPPTLRGH